MPFEGRREDSVLGYMLPCDRMLVAGDPPIVVLHNLSRRGQVGAFRVALPPAERAHCVSAQGIAPT